MSRTIATVTRRQTGAPEIIQTGRQDTKTTNGKRCASARGEVEIFEQNGIFGDI